MASSSRLGNTAQACKSSRDRRYHLRETARAIGYGRVRTCGTPIGHGVALQTLHDGSGGVGGIETCSSVWMCPVCSAQIGMARRTELIKLVEWAKSQNYNLYFLTLTQRHHAGERLTTTWDRLLDTWATLINSGGWRKFKKFSSLVGYVRAVEVTHGRAGWHVHAHVLLVTENDLAKPFDSSISIRGLGEWRDALSYLRAAWPHFLSRAGGTCESDIAVKLDEVAGGTEDVVARYLGKGQGDIGMEMAMGAHKKGRGTRSPFQILADIDATGDADDVQLWDEWCSASSLRRHLCWSRGLKALAGVAEMTDEEAAQQGEGRSTIGFISRQDYLDLLHSGLIPTLLACLESGRVNINDIIGVGCFRIRVYASIEDVPKIEPGCRSKRRKPVWVEREEAAWSNQPLW